MNRDELLAAGIGLAPDDALAIGLSGRDLAGLRDPAARPLRSMWRVALYMCGCPPARRCVNASDDKGRFVVEAGPAAGFDPSA